MPPEPTPSPNTINPKPRHPVPDQQLLETLLAASLRYCAIADWFENHPTNFDKAQETQAANIFNYAESQLRTIGRTALLRMHPKPFHPNPLTPKTP